METNDRGWTLISVVRGDEGGLIVDDDAFCARLSGSDGCKGHMPPDRVSADREILVLDLSSGDWAVLTGWSGSATSALRFLSGERSIPAGPGCDGACSDREADPDLRVRATSGYALAAGSLTQWWRHGGVWIGTGPSPGQPCGGVLASGYLVAHGLFERSDAAGCAHLRTAGPQAIFWR